MKYYRKRLTCFILFTVLLAACGNGPVEAPVLTAPPSPCTHVDNPYRASVTPELNKIYENWVSSNYDVGASSIYRQQAFVQLLNYVEHWSDSVDVGFDKVTVRITITYIHPEIIQAVIVNHYLYRNNTNYKGKLNDHIKFRMEGIAARNEHVFYVTFFAFDPASQTAIDAPIVINFPVRQLELTNTSNMTVRTQRDDHHLENPIHLNNNVAYGFLYYPLGINQNRTCQAVMDQNRDTRIVLRVPNIKIDGFDVGSRAWEYEYAPLIDIGADSPPQKTAGSEASFLDQPEPYVSGQTPITFEEPGFWSMLARIIWLETTLDP